MAFNFHVPTRIIFGQGRAASVGRILKARGLSSALIITDTGVVRAGCLKSVISSLEEHGILYGVYDGVEQNPTEENVEEALSIFTEGDNDAVLAVGGGSSLDTGKALVALLKERRDIRELYSGVLKGEAPVTLMAVPTTSGTGSEVTWSAVITNVERKVKETIRGEYMYPRYAVVDPELTLTLPKGITASTGMDALTHALEAYITRNAHPMSDALAMEAAFLIFGNLTKAVEDGQDIEARSAMSIASTLAGMAFSISGLGMVHGLAEPLGGRFNIPHGIANSVLLPYCLEFNRDAAREKLSVIARLIGVSRPGMDEAEQAAVLVLEVRRLSRQVGIPECLEMRVDEKEVDALVEDALTNSCLPANPRSVGMEDIRRIYSTVVGGSSHL